MAVVRMFSHLFNEEILVGAKDEMPADMRKGIVCYEFSEIEYLKGVDKENLVKVHFLKKLFNANIVAERSGESERQSTDSTTQG